MRLTIAAIVLAALPAAVEAQTRVRSSDSSIPHPSIGLPLPRIGLPLAPIGLSSTTRRPSSGLDTPRHIESRRGGFHRDGRFRSDRSSRTAVFFVPVFGWHYGYPALDATPTSTIPIDASQRRETERPRGSLRLEVEPERDVELYVDGYFAGTLDDLGGELEIEAGLHRIEIRASGFETLELNVRIPAGRSITYRGTLKRLQESLPPDPSVRPPAVVPPTSKKSYFIPGCYLGNVPPKEVNLPATCDFSRMITF